MLAIKDKTTFPCKQCMHRAVCSLMGKMEETKVVLQDDHFSARIECSEFIPILDMPISVPEEDNGESVVWNDVKDTEEEQAK